MGWVNALYLFLRACVISRASLAADNLALRQQLSVFEPTVKRPKLHPRESVVGCAPHPLGTAPAGPPCDKLRDQANMAHC
jgi:hypothetical protein